MYKVMQNPKDKLWYVVGKAGNFYMPISDGFHTKELAQARARKQLLIDQDAKNCLKGV